MVVLKDYHLHLFGCLDENFLAQRVKEKFGKDERVSHAIEIYASKFCLKKGTSLDEDKLSEPDYLRENIFQKKYRSFDEFQLAFDFIIALFPRRLEDPRLLEQVLRLYENQSIEYAEFRTIYPNFSLAESELYHYLEAMIEVIKGHERIGSNRLVSKLVFSLVRDPKLGFMQLQSLEKFLKTRSNLASYVAGLDFCGSEAESPPKELKKFLDKARELFPNKDIESQIRYHVGEDYSHLYPESAIRWILESALLGINRLGHCLAIGQKSQIYLSKTRSQSLSESKDHLDFLKNHSLQLRKYGYDHLEEDLENITEQIRNQRLAKTYTCEDVARLENFRMAMLKWLRDLGPTIEICPTSNLQMGLHQTMSDSPFIELHHAGLNTLLGSDDPGLFGTSLKNEYDIVKKHLGEDWTNET